MRPTISMRPTIYVPSGTPFHMMQLIVADAERSVMLAADDAPSQVSATWPLERNALPSILHRAA